MSNTPKYILDFMEAVYPGNVELALSMFNERKALKDATTTIRRLERELAEVKAKRYQCECGKDSTGWTTIRCCNLCGLPIPEEPWYARINEPAAPAGGADHE